MDIKDSSENKSITGLSFREISSKSLNEKSLGSDLESFLFVDENITDQKKLSTRLKKFFYKVYIKQIKRKGVFAFLFSLIEYLYARVRVLTILFSVVFDMVFRFFDDIKNNFTKRMFWGRGNFLGSTIQVVAFVLIFILAISYLYRKPVVIVASEGHLDRIGVAETDLMVMNASLNTMVPKDRARRATEEYIVKGGDTLSIIAEYYGISTESILWANSMKDTDYIKMGSWLLYLVEIR
jgi:hypothetical protein